MMLVLEIAVTSFIPIDKASSSEELWLVPAEYCSHFSF